MTPDLRQFCDRVRRKCVREGWPQKWTVALCRLLRMGGWAEEADAALKTADDHYRNLYGGPPAWVLPSDVAYGQTVFVAWEAAAEADTDEEPPAPETTRIR